MTPSVDIYRYLWEGRLVLAGVNPYATTPELPALAPFREAFWPLIPQPLLSSPYPPLAQTGFALASLIFGSSPLAFKLAFVGADLLVCAMLHRRFGASAAALWAWNPVVIYSFAGAGHFDSWLVAALVGGWLLIEPLAESKRPEAYRLAQAGALLGMSIALKWISAPLAAWAALRFLRRPASAGIFVLAAALPLAVAYAIVPVGDGTLAPEAFARYARSAEAFPRWLEAVAPATRYDNAVFAVPILLAGLLCVLFAPSPWSLMQSWLLFLFLLSPVFHIWYFTWIIPFVLPNRNPGLVVASASVMTYFLLHADAPGAPGRHWELSWSEHAVLWFPFLFAIPWRQSLPEAGNR
jgi:hypothetical protein